MNATTELVAAPAATEVEVKPKRKYTRRAAPKTTEQAIAEVTAKSKTAKTRKPKPEVTATGYEKEIKFYATRYKQGGRIVYALDLSLTQIVSLIPAPDPARPILGNRQIQPAHAAAFASYIRAHEDWVSPAMVLRGPHKFDFHTIESIEGADFGVVALPRLAVNDLHIVDGQHRILGIHMAINGMSDDLDKARSQLARARRAGESEEILGHYHEIIKGLTIQRKRFETERTSIQIFVEDEQRAYQQMFYDIADNALGITASVRARFDTRKIVNRVLTDVMMHPLLNNRIDMERDRLGRLNPNYLSAKHVVDIVRILAVGLEGRISRRLESELHEDELTKRTNEFFDVLVNSFHQLAEVQEDRMSPAELRQHSMLGSPVTVRVLAGAYFELRNRGMNNRDIRTFFNKLDRFLSAPATDFLVKRAGDDVFFEGALAPSSRRQDSKMFRDVLVEWAENPPFWLTQE